MAAAPSHPSFMDLGIAFLKLSSHIADYRVENRNNITSKEYQLLEDFQLTLHNMGSDFSAKPLLLKADMLNNDLTPLQSVPNAMKEFVGSASTNKQVIPFATKAVALGGAIYLAASIGNDPLVICAAAELINAVRDR